SGKIGFMGKGMKVPERSRSEIVGSLSARLDEKALEIDVRDLDAYRDDAIAMPSILRSVCSKRPDAVVKPDSGELVADILDKCLEEKTPATPRAGATAGLGGSVPVRGGVVVDLTALSSITGIDRNQMTVTVQAGCTWRALEDQLRSEGLGLRAYPSSAALSTVGGWLSTGGLGVGTLASGGFHRQIESMEVAVPSGILIDAGEGDGRYSVRSFAGTEGQAGMVTRMTFPVGGLPERRCSHILYLKRLEDGCGLLESFSDMERPPHLVKMVDRDLAAMLAPRWKISERNSAFVIVAGQGDAGGVDMLEKAVKDEAARTGLEMESLGEESAPWDDYFSPLDTDGYRSVTLAGEVIVATDRLAHLIGLAGPLAGRRNLMCEYTLADRGLVMVRAMRGGSGHGRFRRDVPATLKLVSLAAGLGGRPYGLGIWNSPYSRLALGEYYRNFRVIKRETDRIGILNPGKFFRITTNRGVPVPGWLFHIGLRLAGGT
ncbi:MAG: FAD-binding oxidoreductase, partial [bacterium]